MNFLKPYKGIYHIGQEFGLTPFAKAHPSWYTAYKGIHPGLDIGLLSGTDVWAAHDGILTNTETKGAGKIVTIRNGNVTTRYMHLRAHLKPDGVLIGAGQIIGISDNTGTASTVAHLHFDLNINGKYVNPRDYINFDKEGSAPPKPQEDNMLHLYCEPGKKAAFAVGKDEKRRWIQTYETALALDPNVVFDEAKGVEARENGGWIVILPLDSEIVKKDEHGRIMAENVTLTNQVDELEKELEETKKTSQEVTQSLWEKVKALFGK